MPNSDYYAVAANQWVNTVSEHRKIGAELADAGVTMVRMRPLRWANIQPLKNGSMYWGDWSQVYNAYLQYGIKIVVPLLDTPAWATNGNRVTGAPRDKPWRKFVRAAVVKFPQVYAWETWNEPDLVRFYTGTASQFLRMHKIAHRQIKKHSNAQVWGPAVLYSNIFKKGKGKKIVNKVLISGRLDEFTYHDYSPVDNKVANAVKVLDKVNGRYPIGITEISSHWESLYFDQHSEEEVADDIERIYGLLFPGIKHAMWWPAKDWSNFRGGLMDTSYKGKKQLGMLGSLIGG